MSQQMYIAVEFDLARGERTGRIMEFLATSMKDAAEQLVYTLNLKEGFRGRGWKISPSGRTVQRMTGDIGWHLATVAGLAGRLLRG